MEQWWSRRERKPWDDRSWWTGLAKNLQLINQWQGVVVIFKHLLEVGLIKDMLYTTSKTVLWSTGFETAIPAPLTLSFSHLPWTLSISILCLLTIHPVFLIQLAIIFLFPYPHNHDIHIHIHRNEQLTQQNTSDENVCLFSTFLHITSISESPILRWKQIVTTACGYEETGH